MTDIEADELQSLIDDIRATKVEKEFESNFARVEMYHLIGERITNDNIYRRDGAKVFVTVTQQTKIKKRDLYRAVQFYAKCPDLNALPYGKNVSWHKICNEYLPAPKDKEPEPEMCVCPDCGREHRKGNHMDKLFIKHPNTGEKAEVSKTAYITAKWKDLREFGYTSLTRETVVTEIDNLLAGRPVTVIGEFIRGDLWIE